MFDVFDVRSCRECGCTDDQACYPPCWWITQDLCSSCDTLTPAEGELLEFDRATWKYPGVRDAAILERFGISHTQYVQQLLALLERPAAQAYDPQHVAARRRMVAAGRGRRAGEQATFATAVSR